MKISLLHPSRGRPSKAIKTAVEWVESAGNVQVEHIFSLDESDVSSDKYGIIDQRCIANNNSVVEATNVAAKLANGDILIYLSDDFKCPDKWAELIVKEFENENRPLVIKVHDCLQNFNTRILTIPIMNRSLYERLGYFWHPGYKSMFVDQDLFETCQSIGAVKNCEHLKFPHHHYSNPDINKKAEWDETYRHSEGNWNQGKETFRRRQLEKFKI